MGVETAGEVILNDIERFGQVTEAQLYVMHPEYSEEIINRQLSYLKRAKYITDSKSKYYQINSVGNVGGISYVKEDCLWAVLANIKDKETNKITKEAMASVFLGMEPATYMHIKNDCIYYTLYLPEQSSGAELYALEERLQARDQMLRDKTKIILVIGGDHFRTDILRGAYPTLQILLKYKDGIRGTEPEVNVP